MDKVRIGVIGVGGMGSSHAGTIQKGEIEGATLAAVCDIDPERLAAFDNVEKFADSKKLIRSGTVDAVIIATPHYGHTTIGIDALKSGLHVLVEKPISVHKADCEKLIAAHTKKKQIFVAMFQMRTQPIYQKVKELIDKGELGEIRRVNWIITNWFRTESYYASGGWRATWSGEGGGVLLNQCPHNLDLLQWLCGMPSKMRAFCQLGKYHNIEVEDDVTAYFEYPNGATGVFITTTGEAPGTNRLEISGERGSLVVDHGITFNRTVVPVSEFCATSPARFATPETWHINIPYHGHATGHRGIMQNFVNAILKGEKPIAPAKEGIKSVELANAMLMSSLQGKPVDLPLNGQAFARMLKKLIRESTFVKQTKKVGLNDMQSSFK